MTPADIALIQSQWTLLQDAAPAPAQILSKKLCETAPGLTALFAAEGPGPGARLLWMLGMVVRKLDRPNEVFPVLEAMGRRHPDYGVGAEHLRQVAALMPEMLEQVLGAVFDGSSRQAWAAVMDVIFGQMTAVMTKD